MMKYIIKIGLLATLVLSPMPAFAYYQMCHFFNGTPDGCKGSYNGYAVIETHPGDYEKCHFFNGTPDGCKGSYNGYAVIDSP